MKRCVAAEAKQSANRSAFVIMVDSELPRRTALRDGVNFWRLADSAKMLLLGKLLVVPLRRDRSPAAVVAIVFTSAIADPPSIPNLVLTRLAIRGADTPILAAKVEFRDWLFFFADAAHAAVRHDIRFGRGGNSFALLAPIVSAPLCIAGRAVSRSGLAITKIKFLVALRADFDCLHANIVSAMRQSVK